MTRKERIAVIKECQKAIYDYRRRYLLTPSSFGRGVVRAEDLLFKKRKRLQKRLRKQFIQVSDK